MKSEERDYLFDNLKVLLILLVVLGHSLVKYISDDIVLRSIYLYIFIFHMPLFIYVSGYFSKNVEKCRKNSVKDLLIPFIVFSIISCVTSGNFKFPIYYPRWTLWYLLSLFTWRFFLKDIIKVNKVILLSIILGVIVGLVNSISIGGEDGDLLSFSRTIAFLPFFLLGYYSNKNTIDKIKSYSKTVSILGLIIIGALSFLITKYGNLNVQFIYMSAPYSNYGMSLVEGMLLRIVYYSFSIVTSIFIINLLSSKKNNLSKIGKNTLIIYLGHIYFVAIFKKIIPVFNSTITNLCVAVVFSIIVCGILSLPIFQKIYDYVFGKINNYINNILTKLNIRKHISVQDK